MVDFILMENDASPNSKDSNANLKMKTTKKKELGYVL
jgi:hypothetical protein